MGKKLSGIAAAAAAAFSIPAQAQRAVPAANGSSFTLAAGGTVLQVGPANSARVNSLKHQGAEMLYLNSSGGNILWGSTFWASPQAYWTAACKSANSVDCWPPPAALDGNDFTGGMNAADTAITFTGAADAYTRLRFRKTFAADRRDSSFVNVYHMVNTSASPITWAPWEDTRFPSGGLTFWPTGTGAPTGNAVMLRQTRDSLGITWFTWDSSATLSGTTKIFADAGAPGWFAHVDMSRVLFIKKFADTPPEKKAPGVENECEIYATKALQEMELQGPYTSIPGNDSLAWQVKWYVRKLPEGIAVSRNQALADFVAQVVSGPATGFADPGVGAPQIRMRLSPHALILDLARPLDMTAFLVDARGGAARRLVTGHFAAGSHALPLPDGLSRGPRWLVLREAGSGTAVYRRLVMSL